MPPQKTGAFILYSDLKLYTKDNFVGEYNNVIGICVIDTISLLVSKFNNVSGYGPYNILIPGVTTAATEQDAIKDLAGKQNTLAIINTVGTGNAAGLCNRSKFPVINTPGYLGSCGEWEVVARNRTKINELLSIIKASYINSNIYWTSTQKSVNTAWYWDLAANKFVADRKPDSYAVRAFGEVPDGVTFA